MPSDLSGITKIVEFKFLRLMARTVFHISGISLKEFAEVYAANEIGIAQNPEIQQEQFKMPVETLC